MINSYTYKYEIKAQLSLATQLNICASKCQHLSINICSGTDYGLFWCYFVQICIKFGDTLASI